MLGLFSNTDGAEWAVVGIGGASIGVGTVVLFYEIVMIVFLLVMKVNHPVRLFVVRLAFRYIAIANSEIMASYTQTQCHYTGYDIQYCDDCSLSWGSYVWRRCWNVIAIVSCCWCHHELKYFRNYCFANCKLLIYI